MIDIISGADKKLQRDFIRAALNAHRDNAHYIARLDVEMREVLSPDNPFFSHCIYRLFVAYDKHVPVGRISAQINNLAQKSADHLIGHFGFFDARDAAVASQLLAAAESWLISQGVTHISGPYSFSINDESGILVDGFDHDPYILMNYSPAWLAGIIEQSGYHKAKDLIAFHLDMSCAFPLAAQRLSAQTAKMDSIRIRGLNFRRLETDMRMILKIFNEAWGNNWGFIPMTLDEIRIMTQRIKPILIAQLGQIIEIRGEPVAMILALPNMMEIIKDLHGKLLPWGWAKLLYRLKWRKPRTARVLLMGISPQYREGVMGAAISSYLISTLREECLRRGIEEVEMSWILEDNKAMIRIIEAVGGRAYKRYRIYEKEML